MLDKCINRINEELTHSKKDFFNTHDLICMGIFRTSDDGYQARIKGNSPPYVKLLNQNLYPRITLTSWLKRNLQLIPKCSENCCIPRGEDIRDLFMQAKEYPLLEVIFKVDPELLFFAKNNYVYGDCPLNKCEYYGEGINAPAPFRVSINKDIFYCFKCHVGGDSISFISKYHHLSQKEAAEYINSLFIHE